MVRPYKENCPGGAAPCLDVFTMNQTTQLMNYRLSFNGGEDLIEVASAIGGDGGLDPGRCLSLLKDEDRDAFLGAECTIVVGDTAVNVSDNDTAGVINTVLNATTINNGNNWNNGEVYKILDGTDALIASGTHTGSDDSLVLVDSNSDFTVVRCNVTVTALDDGSAVGSIANDGETDAWRIDANGVKALICDRQSGIVIGKATLTFGFDAVKK
jgi:hypothetical protein